MLLGVLSEVLHVDSSKSIEDAEDVWAEGIVYLVLQDLKLVMVILIQSLDLGLRIDIGLHGLHEVRSGHVVDEVQHDEW